MLSREDKIEIGFKIKYLRNKFDIGQGALGVKALGKNHSAAQAQIRRIELGDWGRTPESDIQKILNELNISLTEIKELEIEEFRPIRKTDSLPNNKEVTPSEFQDIWPEAPIYFEMLRLAQKLNNKELEHDVRKHMALALREQGDQFSGTDK